MNLLTDNDAMVKLGQCRLLSEVRDCFGPQTRYIVTETFNPWFSNRIQKKRIPSFVSSEIESASPDRIKLSDEQQKLISQFASPGLDAGEATLFAAACGAESVVVCTGDKRAIRAVAELTEASSLRNDLQHKLLCIEQSILLAIRAHGFAAINKKVQDALGSSSLDTALRAAFGSGSEAIEANVVATLEAYVDDLRQTAGNLLFDPCRLKQGFVGG